jgi:molybdopterin converting factor small subunit
MYLTFHIPGPLCGFTSGLHQVNIEASSTDVRGALEALCKLYPGIRDRILTEQGEVREHINVFVGNQNIRHSGGHATPTTPGAEISIVAAVSGGTRLRRPPSPTSR